MEAKIQHQFQLNEKDSKHMLRVFEDIQLETGMEIDEIYTFIANQGEKEIEHLKDNYDWHYFRRKILKRLRPGHD